MNRYSTKDKLTYSTIKTVGMAVLMTLSLGVAMAGTGKAQLLDETVSVNFSATPLEEALKTLERLTDARFAYISSSLNLEKKVTLQAVEEKLGHVLHLLLDPLNIQYIVKGESHVLLKSATIFRDTQVVVSGKVTDESGEPLPGVTVLIKGTTSGTVTDLDGNYRINVLEDGILVFSFIGYETKEEPVNGRTVIHMALREDISQLQAVEINAGYYTVTNALRTGSIARVTEEEIATQPVANPLQALQGRMTGVYIRQQTGVPGGGFGIQIRGQNSLRTIEGNDPFYIVDGIPFTANSLALRVSPISQDVNPLNVINPADIESIEVLKDADATAIYGSRGANGVVLITTKKGKAGQTRVDVNVYTGMGQVANKMDLLNTQQYLEMRREAFANDGVEPTNFNARDLLVWDTTRYTDWQEELIGGSARVTNAQVSISGGNEHTQFLFGGGFYRETTVFPGDFAYQRGSGHFNLTHTSPDQRFRAVLTASFAADHNNLLAEDLTSDALTLSPNAPALYDENGELNWGENSDWSNPFAWLTTGYEGKTENLVTNALLSYEVIPGLQLKTTLGYNTIRMNEISTSPLKSYPPAFRDFVNNVTLFGSNRINTWIIEPQAEYSKAIGKGILSLLAGTTFQQNVQQNERLNASGFSSDALLEDINSAANVNVLNSAYTQYRYQAIFGRIHYNWDNRYLINLTGRRDGSSRFGADRQFANFGAAGAAWVFSNEDFMRSVSFLSFGKLRASYGTTGSDQIRDYGFIDAYSSSSYPYDNESGLVPIRLANPEYAWESNQKLEAAIALGFWEDRLFTEVGVYRNRSSNQLVGLDLPGTAAFPTITANRPATVQNTGVEIQLNTVNIHVPDFQWKSSFNMTIPQNKLLEYPDFESSPYANTWEIGKSLYIQKKLHYTGIDPETGVYTFEDVDGNDSGVDRPEDLQALKKLGLDFFGGFQNTFRYKGFQLDVFFQFVKQTGRSYMTGFNYPGHMSNQPVQVMNRWREAGDIADVQRFTQSFGSPARQVYLNSIVYGDNSIVDASFIRLKNVSLSWQLPTVWSEKVKLQSSRIYVQGQNLWTWTDYVGMDPEQTFTSALPPLRMLTAGLQLTL